VTVAEEDVTVDEGAMTTPWVAVPATLPMSESQFATPTQPEE